MRNTMALRSVRTWLLAAALGAACGGGDPPGGGNNNGTTDGGDETDGTTGNGRTDGHVPNPNNPLIAAIPGTWTWEWVEPRCMGERFPPLPEEAVTATITVDPNDPDCRNAVTGGVGLSGDACIHWVRKGTAPPYFILDGENVRSHLSSNQYEGRVFDDGWRIEYLLRQEIGTPEESCDRVGFRKLE